jgi:hypothetical protein
LRDDVKALLHSRGLNMRHLREVVALLGIDSAARSRLELVLHWRRPADEMDVKTVPFPQKPDEQELRKLLEVQQQLLKDGRSRMQLVPTLLRLADLLVGAPVETEKMDGFTRTLRPSGQHPLAKAWEICEQCDNLEAQYRSKQRITVCSKQTLVVMYELLCRDRDSHYPSCWDLEQLIKGAEIALGPRIERYPCSFLARLLLTFFGWQVLFVGRGRQRQGRSAPGRPRWRVECGPGCGTAAQQAF